MLFERFGAFVTYVVSIFTLSGLKESNFDHQVPILHPSAHHDVSVQGKTGPVFDAPGHGGFNDTTNFTCDYRAMGPDWTDCSTPDNRGCWLRNTKNGKEYNISTNYEIDWPKGTHRTYYVTIADDWINADGINFTEAKIFNDKYPGPWVEACWGDTVTVRVENKMRFNGTSIHWHGIRQLNTMHMDGVNGITQCPIAPGDSFNYTWKVMQYGSSWYHSHFSVQYADGATGPMTLHGPTSGNWDESKHPLIMTDWGHNSAFNAITEGLNKPSILLNGRGNVTRYNNQTTATLNIPDPYLIHFKRPTAAQRAKRYLLRLINTSFESTFVFSIDNHLIQIVGADFVPIHPYWNTSVLIGIGQRYHVIVKAVPETNGTTINPVPVDGNFWIRTYRADCFSFDKGTDGYEKTGILRYVDADRRENKTAQADIKSKPWPNISLECSDETYSSLKPVLPWQVGNAANDPEDRIGEVLKIKFQNSPGVYPLAKFSMGGTNFKPLQIDYSNPAIMKLHNTGEWNPLWVVFAENYTDSSWVYMVIRGSKSAKKANAHPIHLHGHDFAILQQIEGHEFPHHLDLKYDNPPRRDVVLVPASGYVVIAFKTDNPGFWLMHCHIAFHASWGLAVTIMERQPAAIDLWPSHNKSVDLRNAQRVCNNWNKWWGNCTNWWPGDNSRCLGGNDDFAPDSGIKMLM